MEKKENKRKHIENKNRKQKKRKRKRPIYITKEKIQVKT